jgi:hypothetical protein
MARVAPSNDQKAAIQAHPEFQIQVKWALLSAALYWKNNDGAGLNAADAKRWATHRFWGAQLMDNPSAVDSQIAYYASLWASYLNNYQMVDDQVPFDAAATINYMIAQSQFQAIADAVFDQKTISIMF